MAGEAVEDVAKEIVIENQQMKIDATCTDVKAGKANLILTKG